VRLAERQVGETMELLVIAVSNRFTTLLL